MLKTSFLIAATALLAISAAPSPAMSKTALPMSVANAWSGQGACLKTSAKIERQMGAELPALLGSAANVSSDPRDQRLAYMQLRYGFDGSRNNGQAWTTADLDVLLLALSDLPANAAPFDDQLVRPLVLDQSLAPTATGTALRTSASIVALDDINGIRVGETWRSLPTNARRVAIFHELAHEFIRQRGAYVNWRPHWMAAVSADAAFAARHGKSDRVSAYAASNAMEDFAESAAAYRYMPARLKERAPNRYKLLKTWMFDGLEYTSAEGCAPTKAKSERAARAAIDHLARQEANIAGGEGKRLRLNALKSAWRALSPRFDALEISALEALLNSSRFNRKLAEASAA